MAKPLLPESEGHVENGVLVRHSSLKLLWQPDHQPHLAGAAGTFEDLEADVGGPRCQRLERHVQTASTGRYFD